MFIWSAQGQVFSPETAHGHKSRRPERVIYACFVLHNYCEAWNDTVDTCVEQEAIQYDRDLQPPTQTNTYLTD